jgi:hypothetical protein
MTCYQSNKCVCWRTRWRGDFRSKLEEVSLCEHPAILSVAWTVYYGRSGLAALLLNRRTRAVYSHALEVSCGRVILFGTEPPGAPYDALARGSGAATATGVTPLATTPPKASRILKLLQVLGEIAMATSIGVPQRRTTLKGATRAPQRGKARAHVLVM